MNIEKYLNLFDVEHLVTSRVSPAFPAAECVWLAHVQDAEIATVIALLKM